MQPPGGERGSLRWTMPAGAARASDFGANAAGRPGPARAGMNFFNHEEETATGERRRNQARDRREDQATGSAVQAQRAPVRTARTAAGGRKITVSMRATNHLR